MYNNPYGGSGSAAGGGFSALVITGQINGGAPPAVVDGAYYIVTTAGGAYALKSVYLGAGGVWTLVYTAATMPIDQAIVPSVALGGGTDTYAAETLYFWDTGTAAFVVDGSIAAQILAHSLLTQTHGAAAGEVLPAMVSTLAGVTKAVAGKLEQAVQNTDYITRTITGAVTQSSTNTAAAGVDYGGFKIEPTYNQTGTAGSADIYVNRTDTALGSGSHYLMDLRVATVQKAYITNTGAAYFAGSVGIGNSALLGTQVNIDSTTASAARIAFLNNGTQKAEIGYGSDGYGGTHPKGMYLTFDNFYFGRLGLANLGAILNSGKVGLMTSTPTYDFSFGGDAARTIGLERHTTSNTAGNNFTTRAGGATLLATDKAGGDLDHYPGVSTGQGLSGQNFYCYGAQAVVGGVITAALNNGGLNYVATETVTITNGANDATWQIDTVDGSGTALTGHMVAAGTTCTKVTGAATTGGSGTGLTINITHTTREVDNTAVLALTLSALAVTTTLTSVAAYFQTSTAPTANSSGTVSIVAKDAGVGTANAGWEVFKLNTGALAYRPYWT